MRQLLGDLHAKLPTADYEIAMDYVEHNEWGLGLEHALDTLIEDGITVTTSEIAEIDTLCDLMDLPNRWREHVRTTDS